MICPKCNSDLVTFKIDGIELEECRMCEGIWFDKNELKQVVNEIDSDFHGTDLNIWKHLDRFKMQTPKYKCPKCCKNLEVFDYDDSGIEMDFCIYCEGVWLDKGEIEKIIDVLEDELVSKDMGDLFQASIKKAKELIKDPYRFITEWKDFKTIVRLVEYRILSRSPKFNKILDAFRKNPLNN